MIATGQMQLVEGTQAEVIPGITLECYPGHTQQCMAVHLDSQGQHATFISDLIPTTAHLDIGWVMGFDLDPLRTIEERKRFYKHALTENWLVLFPHDHRRCMTYLQMDSTGRTVVVKD
jgi:glyoxylase-like metal-dependent hydrolase (beta-lactamase superfamily II)